jgi:hypothetical protein
MTLRAFLKGCDIPAVPCNAGSVSIAIEGDFGRTLKAHG